MEIAMDFALFPILGSAWWWEPRDDHLTNVKKGDDKPAVIIVTVQRCIEKGYGKKNNTWHSPQKRTRCQ